MIDYYYEMTTFIFSTERQNLFIDAATFDYDPSNSCAIFYGEDGDTIAACTGVTHVSKQGALRETLENSSEPSVAQQTER